MKERAWPVGNLGETLTLEVAVAVPFPTSSAFWVSVQGFLEAANRAPHSFPGSRLPMFGQLHISGRSFDQRLRVGGFGIALLHIVTFDKTISINSPACLHGARCARHFPKYRPVIRLVLHQVSLKDDTAFIFAVCVPRRQFRTFFHTYFEDSSDVSFLPVFLGGRGHRGPLTNVFLVPAASCVQLLPLFFQGGACCRCFLHLPFVHGSRNTGFQPQRVRRLFLSVSLRNRGNGDWHPRKPFFTPAGNRSSRSGFSRSLGVSLLVLGQRGTLFSVLSNGLGSLFRSHPLPELWWDIVRAIGFLFPSHPHPVHPRTVLRLANRFAFAMQVSGSRGSIEQRWRRRRHVWRWRHEVRVPVVALGFTEELELPLRILRRSLHSPRAVEPPCGRLSPRQPLLLLFVVEREDETLVLVVVHLLHTLHMHVRRVGVVFQVTQVNDMVVAFPFATVEEVVTQEETLDRLRSKLRFVRRFRWGWHEAHQTTERDPLSLELAVPVSAFPRRHTLELRGVPGHAEVFNGEGPPVRV